MSWLICKQVMMNQQSCNYHHVASSDDNDQSIDPLWQQQGVKLALSTAVSQDFYSTWHCNNHHMSSRTDDDQDIDTL